MTTTPFNTILNYTPNFRHYDSQPSSHGFNLTDLCSDALAAWGIEHSADLSYRVELARRIALTFNNADQIILMDDTALVVPQSERVIFHDMRGCERSLLPSLWLSAGFRYGGRILVYSPPNPIEMKTYLKLKRFMEQHLQRSIQIQILFEDSNCHLHELLSIFQNNLNKYIELCELFAQRSSKDFHPEHHVYMLKRHLNEITKGVHHSFVFPYEMTEFHQQELQSYADRLTLPDLPNNDKAKHNLFLKSKGFHSIPILIAVSTNGKLIDNYQEYIETMEHLNSIRAENILENIQTFARGIIQAIDQLHNQHNVSAFVKLDANGAAGWSCMTPHRHSFMYNYDENQEKRIDYLCEYLKRKVVGQYLPTLAVVEEFIQPQKRSGDIDADYTVCGFVLRGKFFPTSINLCGTMNGSYIEQWTSSLPADLNDSNLYWQHMFQTYSLMVNLETSEFGYANGIYAGDLFVTKDGRHKQRDWNIRRGGRSSPESLIVFGMSNYETKVTLSLADYGLNKKLNNIELFRIYTKICQYLSDDYEMYILSTGFGYCGKDDEKNDYLKFNILVHPKWLVKFDENGEKMILPRCQHKEKVTEILKAIATKLIQNAI
ncbi:unnamed protein product [Rotaria sp. Silwood2]|nr:unnamed protein product [Rotaria sp. Silwood2]CAF2557528.1 unnamed protein product [Rotaria sp. Silwood2]CAF2819580.1 unnamed protein product [Rotaria sp. Silwood2]CAF2972368.1 unnamed protein product [Rotaria sp. Silwood2]CAF3909272.1 unnamed protein product [Rotaria sp. Silwood2]